MGNVLSIKNFNSGSEESLLALENFSALEWERFVLMIMLGGWLLSRWMYFGTVLGFM